MKRIPEPELMEEEAQARAYAGADFSQPHNRFIELFSEAFPDLAVEGYTLDLGCGPGDIAMRFARSHTACTVHGIDGSAAMLACGEELLAAAPDLAGRVEFHRGLLPDYSAIPRAGYDAVISNSLLHHLADASIIWQAVKDLALPPAPVFIMDLMRPQDGNEARRLTEVYMAGEPEILKRDFYNSLLAAYTLEEVRGQLESAGLGHFCLEPVSDRHLAAWGTAAGAR
ncbi:MAG: class I SAM-dependent methyltransferase [Thermoleophilia bacterium]